MSNGTTGEGVKTYGKGSDGKRDCENVEQPCEIKFFVAKKPLKIVERKRGNEDRRGGGGGGDGRKGVGKEPIHRK